MPSPIPELGTGYVRGRAWPKQRLGRFSTWDSLLKNAVHHVPITAFECVFSHCSWVSVLAAAVAQGSCPSLFVSGKNGGYVIVSSLFQNTGKWPKMKSGGTRERTH